jgi:hypothetical protein
MEEAARGCGAFAGTEARNGRALKVGDNRRGHVVFAIAQLGDPLL